MDGTLLVTKEYVWEQETLVTEGLPNNWSVRYSQLNECETEATVEMISSSEMFDAIDTVTYVYLEQQTIDVSDGMKCCWSDICEPYLLRTVKELQPNYIQIWHTKFHADFTGGIQFVFKAYIPKSSPLSFGGYDFSENNKTNDQILVVEDTKFHVNKAVLSLYSPVFHTLFSNENFDESKKDEIELKELNAKQFEVLLQVVFPTTVTVDDENVEFLWRLADRFAISSVAQICESFLCRIEGKKLPPHLCLSNRLKIAQTHRSDKLMSAVCDAMKKMKI